MVQSFGRRGWGGLFERFKMLTRSDQCVGGCGEHLALVIEPGAQLFHRRCDGFRALL
ncbi:hypothetical protein ALQ30_200711 [Pseudomonas syringae pv. persicae]|uniref:Uncharacterized protein n=1 Tax=Pseudomonas syringae pv. persicae TaxID=237306 RepID=A0A3M4A6P9_9PSED|nr:hypothetical protein ALQ30_200711 [Pseudomonas syringae pv. persicae]